MQAILVINAGSSSIKFAVHGLSDEGRLGRKLRGAAEGLGDAGEPAHLWAYKRGGGLLLDERLSRADAGHTEALERIIAWLHSEHLGSVELLGVGHRVVHGGRELHAPTRVEKATLAAIETLNPLAPLHQPHNVAAIRAVAEVDPDLPQVACFDTAFHRTQPEVAQRFALPRRLTDEGVIRYGFHGLSYEHIASVLSDYDRDAARGRTIVAHLGNGASLCALNEGVSVATTMGFTALDGLPMGQRCGSLDPGVVLHLIARRGMDAEEVERLLYQESGLLGVSGESADMRRLLHSDSAAAREAVSLFCYRTVREIGALTAALGGLDALVFTAGIGEKATPIRERICADLAWLGLELDAGANAVHGPCISTSTSRVRAWVIPTDEEGTIARHTLALLNS